MIEREVEVVQENAQTGGQDCLPSQLQIGYQQGNYLDVQFLEWHESKDVECRPKRLERRRSVGGMKRKLHRKYADGSEYDTVYRTVLVVYHKGAYNGEFSFLTTVKQNHNCMMVLSMYRFSCL